MEEKKSYVPLFIEIVEVKMEKGYAASGKNEDFGMNTGSAWD